MSKYSVYSILFFIILFLMLFIIQQGDLSYGYAAIPVVIYVALLVLGSIRIGFNFYFQSLCREETESRKIAITFDDGPHPAITQEVIKLLEKHKVKATFFCIGNQINNNKAIIKLIDNKGHLIGNHTYTHNRWFDLFSAKKMTAEITAINKEIERATGKTPLLFRPPYGVTNPMLAKALKQTGMIPVGWSLRSFDTIHSEEQVLKKLKRKTKGGDVVLFHDTDKKITGIVENYIEWLKKNDFKPVRVDELFNIKGYEKK